MNIDPRGFIPGTLIAILLGALGALAYYWIATTLYDGWRARYGPRGVVEWLPWDVIIGAGLAAFLLFLLAWHVAVSLWRMRTEPDVVHDEGEPAPPRIAAVGMWLFAIAWNVIAVLFALIAVPDFLTGNDRLGIALGVVLFMSICSIFGALYETRRAWGGRGRSHRVRWSH